MFTRLTLGLAVRAQVALADRLAGIRERPDAGMETADKILWAAAITLVVGSVGFIFKGKLETFARNLTVTLGF